MVLIRYAVCKDILFPYINMISLAVWDHKMVSKWHQTATHIVLLGLQHDCLKISSTQLFCNEPLKMQNLQNSNICRYVTHAPASQAKYWSTPLKGYQHHFVTTLYKMMRLNCTRTYFILSHFRYTEAWRLLRQYYQRRPSSLYSSTTTDSRRYVLEITKYSTRG